MSNSVESEDETEVRDSKKSVLGVQIRGTTS